MNTESLVAVREGTDKFDLLRGVIRAAGLFEQLEDAVSGSEKPLERFSIAIKPNFMVLTSKSDISNYTDPELVRCLADELRGRGFRKLFVVESQNVLGQWYENRTVHAVAAHAGFECGSYEIVDLSLESAPYDFRGQLGHHPVGNSWRDADFRISFAKCKSHPAAVYTLSLKNIFGCAARPNKYYDYHKLLEWDIVTLDMLREFPVHFGIIDAIVSSDGPFGFRGSSRPRNTNTMLASDDLVALDWVGAKKMGVDPMRSRLMRLAVREWGVPSPIVSGSHRPFESWSSPPRFLPKLDDILDEWYALHSFLSHCIMLPADSVFPENHTWFYRMIRRLLGFQYAQ